MKTLKIEATPDPLLQCRRHVGVWYRDVCPVCRAEQENQQLRQEIARLHDQINRLTTR